MNPEQGPMSGTFDSAAKIPYNWVEGLRWFGPGLKILFWLEGLFWTDCTKSKSPLLYILPLTKNFQNGYFVKIGGKLPLALLNFEPWFSLNQDVL